MERTRQGEHSKQVLAILDFSFNIFRDFLIFGGILADFFVLVLDNLYDLLVDSAAKQRIFDVDCNRMEKEFFEGDFSHLSLKFVRLSPKIV